MTRRRKPQGSRKVHALPDPLAQQTVCGRQRSDPTVTSWVDLLTNPLGEVTCGGCQGRGDRHIVCPECGSRVPLRRDDHLAVHTARGGVDCPRGGTPA